MWARVVEFMLACFLAISPFIYNYSAEETFLWANDFICAFLIALFALLSFWHPLRKMHLLTMGVAIWLWCVGYQTFPMPATPQENSIVVIALILVMLAIVPSHSEYPPQPWQDFHQSKK
jgi:hypothetical protein